MGQKWAFEVLVFTVAREFIWKVKTLGNGPLNCSPPQFAPVATASNVHLSESIS